MESRKKLENNREHFSFGQQTYVARSVSFYGEGKIGDRCYIGDNVVIGQPISDDIVEFTNKNDISTDGSGEVVIGNDVIIQPNSIIFAGVTIGNGVVVEPFVTVGKNSAIGDKTHLMYYSQVHQNVKIGKNCNIGGFVCDCACVGDDVTVFGSLVHDFRNGYNREQEIAELENISPIIEDHVIVCMGALIIGNVRIKTRSFVVAGTIVTKDTFGDCVIKGINDMTCIQTYPGRLRHSKFFKKCRGRCSSHENY